MRRRQFVGMVGTAMFGISRRPATVRLGEPALSLVLSGGRCFREGGWDVCDIGIDGAGKLRFGTELRAPEQLDISGRIVSPGFIDILADNSSNPAVTFPIFEKYKVTDGVTTALQMHGGSADCADYHRRLGALPHAINYGVSTFVMAIRSRAAGLGERRRQVERNLDEGALGVSHSLEYQPAPFEETLEYARLADKYDRPFFLHLRYSSAERELEGVDEAIRLAQESGARLHIDHLHSTGGTFRMEAALARIQAGISQGLRITTCVYPYTYWATYLSSRRFDPGWQHRYGLTYQDLRVVGTGERLTAESFARYRKSQILVAVPEGRMPFEKTVDMALDEPFCMIGSDGGIQREGRANSHPRGAACFSTAIRHALDRGMPLERMLEKMTTLPRSVLPGALGSRGVLEEGSAADLTVFDPAAIRGNATVENPNQFASGIELVVVNGRVACRDRHVAGRHGVPIRF